MPYCRKCGTKLADDAKYCYKCGAPVVNSAQPAPPQTPPETPKKPNVPIRKNPLFIPVMVIIAITISALVIAVVASAPLNPVNFSEQNRIEQTGQNRLNLDFYANVGDIYVYTNLTEGMVLMDVSATGGTSLFSSDEPVTFMVQNITANGTQIVNANVSSLTSFPFSENLKVVCNIYVNPEADLTLNVKSDVGEVHMVADSNTKISSLQFSTVTGIVFLNLQKGVTVNGGLTLKTDTGSAWFSMNEADINGNFTFDISSSTGDVNLNVTQTQTFNGNLQINGRVGTGNVNLDKLLIDGEVAAKIQSNTGLGQIQLDVKHFNGNQSSIQSNNYPSTSNINMNFNTDIGNINLNATYQTSIEPTLRV
jgi:hypothetical protein